jgi:hypothetical protein
MHGMTDRYDALAGEIMRMMEDDRGLVRSKLADLLEKEVSNWKPDISIGMVASASDHSKLSLKAQLIEAHWRGGRAGEDVCEWDDDQYCGDGPLIKLEPEPKAPSASDVWAAREILMQRITPQQAAAFKDDRVPAFFPPFIMPLPNGGDVGFKAIWSSPMTKVGITASFSNGTEHTFKPRDLVDRDVCEWNDHSKCAELDLSPGSIHWMNAPTDVISAQPDGTRKRRHAIFDDEMDRLRRQWDLEDIRGKRFAHLLHLAESEGLLPELLQGAPDSRQESHRLAADDDTEVLLTSEPDHTCGND